jgi:hypothetical protein
VTQPIQPDRTALASADRDRPLPGRAAAAKTAAGTDHSPNPAPAAAPSVTADVAHAEALRRTAASPAPGGRSLDGAQAAALATRIAERMRGDAALALQTHSGVRPEGVQALLATV